MLNNIDFLEAIRESFRKYLETGTSRSTAKLKALHGYIATSLHEILGDKYSISSQGYGDDREENLHGKYYDKKVDISISSDGKHVGGYAIKFVMRNYSQNSVNYFENMLGETANLKANSIPYYQIIILFDKIPYYKSGGDFGHYEIVTEHNLDKYIKISSDNPKKNLFVPNKILIVLVSLKEKVINYGFRDDNDYSKYYLSIIDDKDLLSYNNTYKNHFGDAVVFNDFKRFMEETSKEIINKSNVIDGI